MNSNKDVLALHRIFKLQKLVDCKCSSFQICTDNRALVLDSLSMTVQTTLEFGNALFYWFHPGVRKWPFWKNIFTPENSIELFQSAMAEVGFPWLSKRTRSKWNQPDGKFYKTGEEISLPGIRKRWSQFCWIQAHLLAHFTVLLSVIIDFKYLLKTLWDSIQSKEGSGIPGWHLLLHSCFWANAFGHSPFSDWKNKIRKIIKQFQWGK